MAFFNDLLLRIRVVTGMTTKGSNLENTEVDDNFLAIRTELNNRDVIGNVQTWSAGTVNAGEARIYDSKLWLCLVTNSLAPSEGSNWTRITQAQLGHRQNTDTKLDEFGTNEVTAAVLKGFTSRIKITSSGFLVKKAGNTSDNAEVGDWELKDVEDVWMFITH
jgi:hypothetical protein